VALPDIIGSAPQKTVGSSPENSQNPTPVANGGQPFILNSVFFKPNEAAMLEREHAIYRAALLRTSIDNMDNVSGESEKVEAPQLPQVRVKQIYLSSVMYSPSGGSVAWINSRKFKEGESFSDLTVKKITPDNVLLSWDLSGFVFDFDNPELKKQKLIKADEKNKTLTFELKSNSRLDVNEMKILSGKTYASSPKPPAARPAGAQMRPSMGAVTNPSANRPFPGMNNAQQNPMGMPQNINSRVNNNPVQQPTGMPPFKPAAPGSPTGNQVLNPNNPTNPPMPNAMPPINIPANSPADIEAANMVENAKSAKNIQAKIKISNDLRAKGRIREADEVDAMIRKIEPNYKKPPAGPVLLKDLGGKNSLPN